MSYFISSEVAVEVVGQQEGFKHVFMNKIFQCSWYLLRENG